MLMIQPNTQSQGELKCLRWSQQASAAKPTKLKGEPATEEGKARPEVSQMVTTGQRETKPLDADGQRPEPTQVVGKGGRETEVSNHLKR